MALSGQPRGSPCSGQAVDGPVELRQALQSRICSMCKGLMASGSCSVGRHLLWVKQWPRTVSQLQRACIPSLSVRFLICSPGSSGQRRVHLWTCSELGNQEALCVWFFLRHHTPRFLRRVSHCPGSRHARLARLANPRDLPGSTSPALGL